MHRVICVTLVLLAATGLGLAAAPAAAASGDSLPWAECTLSIPPRCHVHGGPKVVLLPAEPEAA